jgi:hypothetical protein
MRYMMRPRRSGGSRLLVSTTVLVGFTMQLSGCASHSHKTTVQIEHGSELNEAQIRQIEPGTTTRAQVFEWFGPPHSIFKEDAQILSYENVGFYSYAQTRWLNAVGAGQYGMLYRFEDSVASTVEKEHIWVIFWDGNTERRAKFAGQELLLLLYSKTNVVTDVAYRREKTES